MSNPVLKHGQYVEILAGAHIAKKAWVTADARQDDEGRIAVAFDGPGADTARVKIEDVSPLPLWFAVTGRIPEDDEDETKIYCVETDQEAMERFTAEMYEEDDQDPETVKAANGTDIIITSVLMSTSEIIQTRGIA